MILKDDRESVATCRKNINRAFIARLDLSKAVNANFCHCVLPPLARAKLLQVTLPASHCEEEL